MPSVLVAPCLSRRVSAVKPIDTLPKLKQMLREVGFDAAFPSPAVAWRVFQAYLAIPVVCEEVNALF